MYSSFTNLELFSLVLGCFTYGSCRNGMANYVSGLPTFQGITWLLGWGWPMPGWLEHGQGKAQTTCTHLGTQVLGCCTLTPSNTLQTYWMDLSELQGCEPWVTVVFDGCTELQNFNLEVTLPSSNGNDGYLNTDIPVTDSNRPKKDNFNINQEWNPWLLEDWSRILLHTVECKLFHLIISESLSASIVPGENSSI